MACFRRYATVAAALCAVASVSACGSGSQSGHAAVPVTPQHTLASASITITIPARHTSSAHHQRAPRYVSAASSYLILSVSMVDGAPSGVAPQTVDLNSTDCVGATSSPTGTSGTTSGALTCTIAASLPVGSDAVTIVAYSGTAPSGTPLSGGNLSPTIAPNTANMLAVTLNGIAASADVALTNPGTAITSGTAATIPLTVTVLDASGEAISGSAPFDTPVQLTDSDTSGATALLVNGTPSTTVNAPTDAVTLTYNGAAIAGSVTVGVNAAASGISAANTQAATVSVAGSGTYTACTGSHLYVNDDYGGLIRYAMPVTSTSAGTTLQSAGQNVAVAFDPSCNVYLTSYFSNVSEYATPYTGAPIATYGGAANGDPYGIAIDNSGHLFIAEQGANQVIELSSISGTVIQTIPVSSPYMIALGPDASLYVASTAGVSIFAPPYTQLTQTVALPSRGEGVAVDAARNLFVSYSDAIAVYAPPYAPTNLTATINESSGAGPLAVAVDANENVYIANYGNSTVVGYASPYTQVPFFSFAGSLADGIAVGP
jgi:hypothetical protein